MKLYHNEREIENNAIDYHNGMVMIRYIDTDEVAIVPKKEIHERGNHEKENANSPESKVRDASSPERIF